MSQYTTGGIIAVVISVAFDCMNGWVTDFSLSGLNEWMQFS